MPFFSQESSGSIRMTMQKNRVYCIDVGDEDGGRAEWMVRETG